MLVTFPAGSELCTLHLYGKCFDHIASSMLFFSPDQLQLETHIYTMCVCISKFKLVWCVDSTCKYWYTIYTAVLYNYLLLLWLSLHNTFTVWKKVWAQIRKCFMYQVNRSVSQVNHCCTQVVIIKHQSFHISPEGSLGSIIIKCCCQQ